MDGPAFDSLTRRLTGALSRRSAVRAMLGAGAAAVVGAVTVSPPAGAKKKKKKCAVKCGKLCCKKTQICSDGACKSVKRCPAGSGIGGFCDTKATCCPESKANPDGGCCNAENPVCCANIEGCCASDKPICCADTKSCCQKGTVCCPKSAAGGCCPSSAPVCCSGSGFGKYCCPSGNVCCPGGCCPAAGNAGSEQASAPVARSPHDDMAARG